MTEEEKARRLAAWLDAGPGADPPEDLDPEVLAAVYALRSERAPSPRVGFDEVMAAVRSGPFAEAEEPVPVAAGTSEAHRVPAAPAPFGGRAEVVELHAPEPELALLRPKRRWIGPALGLGLAAAAAAALVVPMAGRLGPADPVAEEHARFSEGSGAPATAPPASPEPRQDAAPLAEEAKPAGDGAALAREEAAPIAEATPAVTRQAPAGPADEGAVVAGEPARERSAARPAASPPRDAAEDWPDGLFATDDLAGAEGLGGLGTVGASSGAATGAGGGGTSGYGKVDSSSATAGRALDEAPTAPSAPPPPSAAPREADEEAEVASVAKKESRSPGRGKQKAEAKRASAEAPSAAPARTYRWDWYGDRADVADAYARGDYAALLDHAEPAVAQDAAWRLARAQRDAGRVDEALATIERGLARGGGDPVFRANLLALKGDLLAAGGRRAEAEAAWAEAERLGGGP